MESSVKTVIYAQQQPTGTSLRQSMMTAYRECEATVKRIASSCRARNRKFRDVDFDLENDRNNCLHSLELSNIFNPPQVRRVTDIFDNPVFYKGTPESADIIEGEAMNCHLVSALSNIASMDDLIKNVCVARDEAAGVYGFIFYRDSYWISVIIDNLLFIRAPKYELLTKQEQELHYFDRDAYIATACKGSSSLYFSKPAHGEETWVPLLEKAYAKAHGDYESISYGRTCDVIEDLTGFGLPNRCVSNQLSTKDILDHDKFWQQELVKVNQDRLFGCWFDSPDGYRSGKYTGKVEGLFGHMSYSVVRAVEVKGKRFVVMRDPSGTVKWNGRWCDGSKEWTPEWLEVLPEIGHSFGRAGQFVMEYNDFLSIWREIQRTLIFDENWIMSSQWLLVEKPYASTSPRSFGDIVYRFILSASSHTVVVLTKYDTTYFEEVQGPSSWNLDFVLAKEGTQEPLCESCYSFFHSRNVSVELDLEPGAYVVLARLDATPTKTKDYFSDGISNGWNTRKVARRLTERAKGQSLASNYTPNPALFPAPVSKILASEAVKTDRQAIDTLNVHGQQIGVGEDITISTMVKTTQTITKSSRSYGFEPIARVAIADDVWDGSTPCTPTQPTRELAPAPDSAQYPPVNLAENTLDKDNSIVVGLKVYTYNTRLASISGRLGSD
ncbi:hypothetical protein D9619_006614 [Psilocybe cf. subviscida]|uniref:Calpain catalytic domain-containing protein n=1 Tax=Psilocybe cf. subviscida TaxID=2480587 RepID=A0A8H5B5F9_9AGAR|nr:hypothetical protein D9619_006614 [Psilocybe cf. subviscida]